MSIRIFLISFLISVGFANGQDLMIVFFKDKQSMAKTELPAQNDGLAFGENNFTQRSLDRRILNNVEFDQLDIPVNPDYLSAIQNDGIILNTSKWLNAISFKSTISSEELTQNYDFILRVETIHRSATPAIDKFEAEMKSLNYGEALAQINQINLDCLHDLGFTGEGTYIGILDAGFINMDSIVYFDSLYLDNRVLDTFNFVNGSTYVYAMSGHGTSVSSCIFGNKAAPDEYAGAAIDADVALFITEDVGSETEIEEFNLVAGLERCDSLGVNVVNISLGYFGFDDTLTSHVYADMDGQTTIAAMGVNVAYSKGIIVVTSAGNSGPGKITTPCDADSCLCIGAVDVSGNLAFFSSLGPSADGQVKPDVVATGLDASLISSGGNLSTGSGTSFSSPITAGAVACLVQAHPTKSASQIMAAVRQSASQFSSPDTLMGYGIPDFCLAHDILSVPVNIDENSLNGLSVYPVPSSDYFVIEINDYKVLKLEVNLVNSLGKLVLNRKLESIEGKFLLDIRELGTGVYSLQIALPTGRIEHKLLSIVK